MTTILVTNSSVYTDGRTTCGPRIVSSHIVKAEIISDGSRSLVVTAAGDADEYYSLVEQVREDFEGFYNGTATYYFEDAREDDTKIEIDQLSQFEGVILRDNGVISLVQAHRRLVQVEAPITLGSGGDLALGAFLGLSEKFGVSSHDAAVAAMKIACKFDALSGGSIFRVSPDAVGVEICGEA